MDKKVNLSLVGLDGNAFVLMGAWRRQAQREGWTPDEINTVLTEAKSGDYSNLVRVLSDHCVNGGYATDDDDDEDYDEEFDEEEE